MPSSALLTVPYDGTISSGFGDPLGGDQGWCGDPRAYVNRSSTSTTYAGDTVSSASRSARRHHAHRSNPAFAIDDIKVQGCVRAARRTDHLFADGFDGTP